MDCEHWSRAQHIDALWSTVVEASFPKESYTIIHDWPVESSAQARICADKNGCLVAARFEVYAGGLELANGYHELADAVELRERMETIRAESGQKCQDERFFAALAQGLPDVSGVALGFDRLVMLASGAEGISAVQAFGEG
jgi:lysyl-tRNA synthetase class 2